MLFDWLSERRRRRILEQPFRESWLEAIEANVAAYSHLDDSEQEHLRQLVQVFIEEKRWEGAGGLEIDDEVQATIAAQACLLILGLEHALYRRVESIIVYPSTVVTRPQAPSIFSVASGPADRPMPILGQAFVRGPVILVWDAVRCGGIDPRDGRNVVFHEFAHKLDMLSGAADGVPPLADDDTYQRWVEVLTCEYEALKKLEARGKPTFLNRYALKNGAEFFAVATEHFFEQPLKMQRDHKAMYDVLGSFYRQDPAARERRVRSSEPRPAS
jgi:Mlc titration factor MtfA (ptsG expression regulator)